MNFSLQLTKWTSRSVLQPSSSLWMSWNGKWDYKTGGWVAQKALHQSPPRAIWITKHKGIDCHQRLCKKKHSSRNDHIKAEGLPIIQNRKGRKYYTLQHDYPKRKLILFIAPIHQPSSIFICSCMMQCAWEALENINVNDADNQIDQNSWSYRQRYISRPSWKRDNIKIYETSLIRCFIES